MPVFHFHIVSPGDLVMRDREGLDLPDRSAAFEAGMQLAKRHEDCARFGSRTISGWYVEVTAEDGELCWLLPIGEEADLRES